MPAIWGYIQSDHPSRPAVEDALVCVGPGLDRQTRSGPGGYYSLSVPGTGDYTLYVYHRNYLRYGPVTVTVPPMGVQHNVTLARPYSVRITQVPNPGLTDHYQDSSIDLLQSTATFGASSLLTISVRRMQLEDQPMFRSIFQLTTFSSLLTWTQQGYQLVDSRFQLWSPLQLVPIPPNQASGSSIFTIIRGEIDEPSGSSRYIFKELEASWQYRWLGQPWHTMAGASATLETQPQCYLVSGPGTSLNRIELDVRPFVLPKSSYSSTVDAAGWVLAGYWDVQGVLPPELQNQVWFNSREYPTESARPQVQLYWTSDQEDLSVCRWEQHPLPSYSCLHSDEPSHHLECQPAHVGRGTEGQPPDWDRWHLLVSLPSPSLASNETVVWARLDAWVEVPEPYWYAMGQGNIQIGAHIPTSSSILAQTSWLERWSGQNWTTSGGDYLASYSSFVTVTQSIGTCQWKVDWYGGSDQKVFLIPRQLEVNYAWRVNVSNLQVWYYICEWEPTEGPEEPEEPEEPEGPEGYGPIQPPPAGSPPKLVLTTEGPWSTPVPAGSVPGASLGYLWSGQQQVRQMLLDLLPGSLPVPMPSAQSMGRQNRETARRAGFVQLASRFWTTPQSSQLQHLLSQLRTLGGPLGPAGPRPGRPGLGRPAGPLFGPSLGPLPAGPLSGLARPGPVSPPAAGPATWPQDLTARTIGQARAGTVGRAMAAAAAATTGSGGPAGLSPFARVRAPHARGRIPNLAGVQAPVGPRPVARPVEPSGPLGAGLGPGVRPMGRWSAVVPVEAGPPVGPVTFPGRPGPTRLGLSPAVPEPLLPTRVPGPDLAQAELDQFGPMRTGLVRPVPVPGPSLDSPIVEPIPRVHQAEQLIARTGPPRRTRSALSYLWGGPPGVNARIEVRQQTVQRAGLRDRLERTLLRMLERGHLA